MSDVIYLPDHLKGDAKPTLDVDRTGGGARVRVTHNPLDRVHAEPTPPPAWRRRLEALWPRSEQQQWMILRMFPERIVRDGTEFRIVSGSGRWALYTMTPAALIADPTKLEQLRGAPWWELPKEEQFGRQQMVSAYQWEMFRQHQCWARPYWCIQGDQGGTPMQYSLREAAILRANGLPQDVPDPGTLPFAPFDERVVTAVMARDRFRTMGSALDRLIDPQKAAEDMRAEEAEAEIVFRTEFVKFFKARMEPNAEFIAQHLGKSENAADFRPATASEASAADQWEDQYIATGTVPVALPE